MEDCWLREEDLASALDIERLVHIVHCVIYQFNYSLTKTHTILIQQTK